MKGFIFAPLHNQLISAGQKAAVEAAVTKSLADWNAAKKTVQELGTKQPLDAAEKKKLEAAKKLVAGVTATTDDEAKVIFTKRARVNLGMVSVGDSAAGAGVDPTHVNDATGAFHPGANRFKKLHDIDSAICYFDNDQDGAHRRKEIYDAIDALEPGIEVVAYFGHGDDVGQYHGLPSAGIAGKAEAGVLAGKLGPKLGADAIILLYACKSGTQGSGFSTLLAAEPALNSKKVVIYGHDTAGHSYLNARVTMILSETQAWSYVIAPTDKLYNSWQAKLPIDDLWATFAWMTDEDLKKVLDPPK
jgi:hypothetical protein